MKILLACGGTGGHIFPAFSVAEALKRRHPDAELVYVCGKKDIENVIFKMIAGEKILSIDSAPFRGAISLIDPVNLIKLISGFFKGLIVLARQKPDLIVGFGGYLSFPLLVAGFFLRKKTLIHEQNVIPGLANRWLALLTNGVAVSFAETLPYFKRKKMVRVTGNPIRSSIELASREEALRFFGFSKDKWTILVLGGSQGSESINRFFVEMLRTVPKELRDTIQVLHLCGKMPVEMARKALEGAGVDGKVYSFFERMDLVYAVSDLAIGRAGATFLAEIETKQIPALLVPYPYGNGHQLLNAEVHARRHPARVLEQKSLTSHRFQEEVVGLIGELKKEEHFSPGAQKKPSSCINARERLADFIEELAIGK